jgi:predicted metalloprotease
MYDTSAFRNEANTLSLELRADCFAWVYGAHLDSAGVPEAGEAEEVTTALLIIPYHGPALEQAHGKPEQRVDAYFEGFNAASCENYAWPSCGHGL